MTERHRGEEQAASAGPGASRKIRALLTVEEAVRAEINNTSVAQLASSRGSRCYVCCQPDSRKLVNSLIAAGLSLRQIVNSCEAINELRRRDGDDRLITFNSVKHHRLKHFNVTDPALAAYREIMERRAAEENKDYINGVAHAVTPYAVLETIMVKGYGHVVEEETEITTKEAIKAATELHEMTRSDADGRRMADLLYQMDRIVRAAQDFIPISKQADFLALVQGREPPKALKAKTTKAKEPVQEEIRTFTPSTTVDEEDEV